MQKSGSSSTFMEGMMNLTNLGGFSCETVCQFCCLLEIQALGYTGYIFPNVYSTPFSMTENIGYETVGKLVLDIHNCSSFALVGENPSIWERPNLVARCIIHLQITSSRA